LPQRHNCPSLISETWYVRSLNTILVRLRCATPCVRALGQRPRWERRAEIQSTETLPLALSLNLISMIPPLKLFHRGPKWNANSSWAKAWVGGQTNAVTQHASCCHAASSRAASTRAFSRYEKHERLTLPYLPERRVPRELFVTVKSHPPSHPVRRSSPSSNNRIWIKGSPWDMYFCGVQWDVWRRRTLSGSEQAPEVQGPTVFRRSGIPTIASVNYAPP